MAVQEFIDAVLAKSPRAFYPMQEASGSLSDLGAAGLSASVHDGGNLPAYAQAEGPLDALSVEFHGDTGEYFDHASLSASGGACTIAYWHRVNATDIDAGDSAGYAVPWSGTAVSLLVSGNDPVYTPSTPRRYGGVWDGDFFGFNGSEVLVDEWEFVVYRRSGGVVTHRRNGVAQTNLSNGVTTWNFTGAGKIGRCCKSNMFGLMFFESQLSDEEVDHFLDQMLDEGGGPGGGGSGDGSSSMSSAWT